jgi:hypothetical protein
VRGERNRRALDNAAERRDASTPVKSGEKIANRGLKFLAHSSSSSASSGHGRSGRSGASGVMPPPFGSVSFASVS